MSYNQPVDMFQLSMGAIVALLIIKEVFSFLKSKDKSDHAPAWYVMKSLNGSVKSLAESTAALSLSMRDIRNNQEYQNKILEQIAKAVK